MNRSSKRIKDKSTLDIVDPDSSSMQMNKKSTETAASESTDTFTSSSIEKKVNEEIETELLNPGGSHSDFEQNNDDLNDQQSDNPKNPSKEQLQESESESEVEIETDILSNKIMELKKNQVNPKEKNKLEQSPTTIYKNRLFEIVNDLMIKHPDITEDKLIVRAKIMLEKENMKKSDSTPSGYVPPNKAFTCEFIKNWLNIKLIWSLRATPQEQAAIMTIIRDNQCDPRTFIVTAANLKVQRDYMEDNADLCESPTTALENF